MNRLKFSFIVATAMALIAILSLSSCSGNSNPMNSGGGGGTPPPANAVNISGFAFSPASISIKAGVKLTWTNKDGTTHTVTSDNGAFTSSGDLATGDTYEFTFMTAGTYHYHCAIHPAMKGTVTVTP